MREKRKEAKRREQKTGRKKCGENPTQRPEEKEEEEGTKSTDVPEPETTMSFSLSSLEATGEKETVTYKGVPIRLSADFSRDLTGKKGLEKSIRSCERKGLTPKMTLSSKAII